MTDLLKHLRGDVETVCKALDEITSTPDEPAREALTAFIEDSTEAEAVREKAAQALGRCRSPECRERLIALGRSEEAVVRGLVAIGLGEDASDQAVSLLVEMLTDRVNSVRNLAERGLLQHEDRLGTTVERLLELLDHPVPLTRSPAARMLGKSGDPRGLEPLLDRLKNERQWLVRMWAAKALGDLGEQAAVPDLVQALNKDERNRVRAAAAEAIGRLRPPDAEAMLRHAIRNDQDGGVRKIAGEALQAVGFDSDDAGVDPFDDG